MGVGATLEAAAGACGRSSGTAFRIRSGVQKSRTSAGLSPSSWAATAPEPAGSVAAAGAAIASASAMARAKVGVHGRRRGIQRGTLSR